MELIFNAGSILERGKGLTFDDVLLIPQHSEISSRKHPVLRSKVTKNWELETPIVAANMDTITEIEMANAMAKLGGMGIIHRFMDTQTQGQQLKDLRNFLEQEGIKSPVSASIGVKEENIWTKSSGLPSGLWSRYFNS